MRNLVYLIVITVTIALSSGFQFAPSTRVVRRGHSGLATFKTCTRSTPLLLSSDDTAAAPDRDYLVLNTSKTLSRFSWLSWWSQSILTVISSITLIFARNVVRASSSSKGGDGLLLAGTAIIFSFISIFWTWATARLGKRLTNRQASRILSANLIRRAIKVGVTCNLVGIATAILGAGQIVGSLAIKALSQQGVVAAAERATVQTLQPLDILIVQGNLNTILSHFSSLSALLFLTRLVSKLDPPSEEGSERSR